MPIAFLALLACEAELTVVAVAVGWRFPNPRAAMITAAISIAFAVALFGLWLLWFVAPGCVVNADCAVPASSYANLGAGASLQWAWLLAIALGARFAKSRNLAHISG